MALSPFEGSIDVSLDTVQAKILIKLLKKQVLVPAEWRELIGLEKEIEQSIKLEETPAQPFNVNSSLFNNRNKF